MSVVERLENTVAENEGDVITLDDARALLALVEAVQAWKDELADWNAKQESMTDAERDLYAALAAVVEGGA